MLINKYGFIIIAASLLLSPRCGNTAPETTASAVPVLQTTASVDITAPASDTAPLKLPRIIDFGSKQCKACKAMEPVLESLARNHADKFKTEFVDVWVPENQTFAKSYDISSIPTQVFLNADGKEVYRNTGFISEEDVIAKFTELGIIPVEAKNAPSAGAIVETAIPAVEQTASETVDGK